MKPLFLHLQGAKCELKVKNGAVYEGVFKTYGPEVSFSTFMPVYFLHAAMSLDCFYHQ